MASEAAVGRRNASSGVLANCEGVGEMERWESREVVTNGVR